MCSPSRGTRACVDGSGFGRLSCDRMSQVVTRLRELRALHAGGQLCMYIPPQPPSPTRRSDRARARDVRTNRRCRYRCLAAASRCARVTRGGAWGITRCDAPHAGRAGVCRRDGAGTRAWQVDGSSFGLLSQVSARRQASPTRLAAAHARATAPHSCPLVP